MVSAHLQCVDLANVLLCRVTAAPSPTGFSELKHLVKMRISK